VPKPFPTPRWRGRKWRNAAGVMVCVAGLAVSGALAGSATAAVARSGGPEFVRIGTVPHLAGAVALGRVPGSQRIDLDVALRPRDPAALASFVAGVSDPRSAEFRRYLPRGAFGSVFGATTATVRTTVATLRSLGFHVGSVSNNHLVVNVSSTVATAERAFDTTLERYRLGSGASVYANMSAPLVPSAIAGGIQAVEGLDDLALVHPADLRGARPAAGAVRPASRSTSIDVPGGPEPCARAADQTTGDPPQPYTADEIASVYGFSELYQAADFGAGVTMAVFELEPFDQPDVRAYDECYFGQTQGETMSSSPQLNVLTVDGAQSGLANSEDVESTLDVEEVSGFLPGATIDVYEGPNTNTGPLDVWNSIFTQDTAEVITTSWGACEAQDGGSATVAAEANLFEQAAAQGQTVVAASGDSGSSDCTDASDNPIAPPAVDDPGSQPYVTSVGGTSMTNLGSPAGPTTPAVAPKQSVWNSDNGASGGGISSNWAMPAYQADAAPALGVVKAYSSPKPCGAPAGFCREVPDVSADADPDTGLVIYWDSWGGWSSVGGTSIAAPMWAALVVLADAWPACATRPVGFLNPTLYWIAGMGPSEYASAFDDVTVGNNHLPQFPSWWQYPATTGYDLATGLGTPIAANEDGGGLVARLCSLPESGGASYASPTRSSIVAVLSRVKAKRTASSWIKVTLRTALGLPIASKRVILVGTVPAPSGAKMLTMPVYLKTNTKGVAIFQVSDTLIQKVTYRATDITDGVLIPASATVSYVRP
jgi:subtilase family serine protease